MVVEDRLTYKDYTITIMSRQVHICTTPFYWMDLGTYNCHRAYTLKQLMKSLPLQLKCYGRNPSTPPTQAPIVTAAEEF